MLNIRKEYKEKSKACLFWLMKKLEATSNSISRISKDTFRKDIILLNSIGLFESAIGPKNAMKKPQAKIVIIIKFAEINSTKHASAQEKHRNIPTEIRKHMRKLAACHPPVNILNAPNSTMKIRVYNIVLNSNDINKMQDQLTKRSINICPTIRLITVNSLTGFRLI